MPGPIVIVGAPTALGGHFPGMERTPGDLRRRGIVARIAARAGLAGRRLVDTGDAPVEPGWAPDPDPRAKNRALLTENLPRISAHVGVAMRDAGPDARLHVLGGDCTAHAAALAALAARHSGSGATPGSGHSAGGRLALAWFDAHGDFNTPDTTPSGNVWGMPFAMACGRGDPDLVGAVDGPTVREVDAALLGGQVLDETESRMLASSGVAHFGAGMLGDPAGLAALAGWAASVAGRVDGCYVAFDMDALDAGAGWALTMPEPGGISLATAVAAVRALAEAMPILGIGTTAIMIRPETPEADIERTVDAVAALVEAALGDVVIDRRHDAQAQVAARTGVGGP